LLDFSNLAYEESGINEWCGEMNGRYIFGTDPKKEKRDDDRAGKGVPLAIGGKHRTPGPLDERCMLELKKNGK
jgi:hypothetical protein